MRRLARFLALLALLGCSRPSPPGTSRELLVFAAASLRDCLTEIGQDYEQETTVAVHFNFAGSNALAQQLVAAPRADVFFSASEAWMDRVEQANALEPGTRRTLLGNQLVAIAHRDAPLKVDGVCDLTRGDLDFLVLGNPGAVPAGVYAKQYLEGTRCGDARSAWDLLSDRVLPTPDVRAALAQVELSPRVAGFTYRTDAATSRRVRVLHTVTGRNAPAITHPVALVRGHGGPGQRRFLEYLAGSRARQVFERHGFQVHPQVTASRTHSW